MAAVSALMVAPALAGATQSNGSAKANQPEQTSGQALPQSVVKKLQRRLIQTGYLQTGKMAASGHWDRKTTLAVRLFQKDYGLPPDGQPDPATLKALNIQAGD